MKYGRNSVSAWVVHLYVNASLIDTDGVPVITYRHVTKYGIYEACKILLLRLWPPWCIICDTKAKVSS